MSCYICGNNETIGVNSNNELICKNCSSNLIKCSDPSCNTYLKNEELFFGQDGFLCKKHWNENYFICSDCGNIYPRSFIKLDTNNRFICDKCFIEKYTNCSCCGKLISTNEAKSIYDEDHEQTILVCSECYEEEFVVCPHCNKRYSKYSLLQFSYLDKNNKHQHFFGCSNCILEKFNYCESCDSYFLKSLNNIIKTENNDSFCESCYYKTQLIHNYSYKPSNIIIYKKNNELDSEVLYGVENEIELNYNLRNSNFEIISSNNNTINIDFRNYIAYNINKILPSFIYLKHDGSLSYGIELVSHPSTYNGWLEKEKEIEDLFKFLIENNCEGDTAKTAGMHVHISKKDMNKNHIKSLSAFIYGNKTKLFKLARRKQNRYSKFISLNKKTDDLNLEIQNKVPLHDRYMAVNWSNRNTVEIRIFQSTLNTAKFLSNIEFCRAAYEFTKTRSIAECLSQRTWRNFCSFVNDNNYKFLPDLMIHDEIWPKKLIKKEAVCA